MPLPSEQWTSPDRCYWYRDGDGEVLIPMCLGCAVNGPEQCTCDVPESRIESAERGRHEAEREVERLRDKLERQHELHESWWNQLRRYRQRIEELEAR